MHIKLLTGICQLPTAFIRRSFSIGVLLLLPTFNYLKAQDDDRGGIVVDGILVDSIASWSFEKMDVLFPISQSWQKYDLIQGVVYFDAPKSKRMIENFQLKPADLENYINAKYAVFTAINNATVSGKKTGDATYAYCSDCGEGGDFKTKPGSNYKPHIYFVLKGHNITNYKEYKNNYGVFIKEPQYANGLRADDWQRLSETGDLLFEIKSVPCNICYCVYNKSEYKKVVKKEGMAAQFYLNTCEECKIDYLKKDIQPGKKFSYHIEKVDFVGKFGKIKEQVPSEIKKEEPVKTTQPAKKKSK